MDSLVTRFGYRGAALFVLGITWVFFGASVMLQPSSARPWVFHELIPLPVRAGLWVTAGIAAIIAGWRGSDRDDTLGMVALMVMPLERCLSFAISYVAFGISWLLNLWSADIEVVGYDQGWYGATIWLLIVTLIRLVAGWPNPRKVLPVNDVEPTE